MTVRHTFANQTERLVGFQFCHALRNEPSGSRLGLLRDACVESRDLDWHAAYHDEEVQRARHVQDLRAFREEVDALMVVARRFFRGVYDAEGHGVPRVLAACMNGSTPSALESASVAERVRALSSLLVNLRGYRDVHFDAAVLGELTVAVQRADQSMQRANHSRRVWREAVNRKQECAGYFDPGYRAMVTAARILGMRDALPGFVDPERPDEPTEDPSTEPPPEDSALEEAAMLGEE